MQRLNGKFGSFLLHHHSRHHQHIFADSIKSKVGKCSQQLYLVRPKSTNRVVIPNAIKRGPTDILEALSATVSTDYTGPSYKYLDDPYLTPMTNGDKRNFSLSKEAGRKAALYFFDTYPQYFYRDISEPKIEAFTYKEIFDENMEFEELDLHKCIGRREITNAIICYQGLRKQGVKISDDILYDLLELVCFYNCENVPEHFVEEDWFKKTYPNQLESNFWKDNGFAEQLFDTFPAQDNRAYSALIVGMCKYSQTERAFVFYKKALDQGLPLHVYTYNALIASSYSLHTTNEERWKTVLDLLRTMHTNQIKPNLTTLNVTLKQISKYKFWNQNNDLAKKTFNEFAFKFGIKPSLATYYYLLNIFYKNRSSRSSLIYEIVDKLSAEGSFELQDVDDVNFFFTAMDICSNLNDYQLAYKVHQLVEKNEKFMGKGFNQNIYYNRFLKLLCSSETVENFMVVYNKYVPHIYTPIIDLMEHILKTIKIYKSLDFVPQLWNDIILFGYINRMELLQVLLSTMDEVKPKDALVDTFGTIAADIFARVNLLIARDNERRFVTNFQWNAKALSYCISVLVKADKLDAAYEVFTKLNDLKYELLDQCEPHALIAFSNSAIDAKKYDYLEACLQFCQDMEKKVVIEEVTKQFKQSDDKNDEELQSIIKRFATIND